MPKHTRIYTRTGDDGTTGLFGGPRVRKDALRIESYGAVDELSSTIGVVRVALGPTLAASARSARLDAWLAWVQDMLFDLGSELATLPQDRRANMPVMGGAHVAALERAIDEAENDLAPLDTFILPGGSQPGAQLHVARTVCRRAERRLVSLRASDETVSIEIQHFLNRLSDALFVWSRWINDELQVRDVPWRPQTAPPA